MPYGLVKKFSIGLINEIDGKFCKIRCIVKKLFGIKWLKGVRGVVAE